MYIQQNNKILYIIFKPYMYLKWIKFRCTIETIYVPFSISFIFFFQLSYFFIFFFLAIVGPRIYGPLFTCEPYKLVSFLFPFIATRRLQIQTTRKFILRPISLVLLFIFDKLISDTTTLGSRQMIINDFIFVRWLKHLSLTQHLFN